MSKKDTARTAADTPEADTREWWMMQAKRYQAETEQVTNDARAAAAKQTDDTALLQSTINLLKGQINAATAEIKATEEALLLHQNALAEHKSAIGDIMQAFGPAFARAAKLIGPKA